MMSGLQWKYFNIYIYMPAAIEYIVSNTNVLHHYLCIYGYAFHIYNILSLGMVLLDYF